MKLYINDVYIIKVIFLIDNLIYIIPFDEWRKRSFVDAGNVPFKWVSFSTFTLVLNKLSNTVIRNFYVFFFNVSLMSHLIIANMLAFGRY